MSRMRWMGEEGNGETALRVVRGCHCVEATSFLRSPPNLSVGKTSPDSPQRCNWDAATPFRNPSTQPDIKYP